MKTAVLLCMTLLLTTIFAWPQGTEKKPAAKPIQALGWLVGGVWTADGTKMGNGLRRIETRYQWSDNDAYIRFTTHFVFDKGVARTYDGSLYWDPEKNSLGIWYMDTENSIIQGPMQWQNSVLQVTFRGQDFEGKMADLKVDVTQKTNDHYHWAVSEKAGDAWKELTSLEYLRVSGS